MGSSQSAPVEKTIKVPLENMEVQPPCTSSDSTSHPVPKGDEYDKLDELLDSLPKVVDPESQAQIEEYVAACDNGNGPAVSCFSTAEYLSLMERKYEDAVKLYENTCFRSLKDKSPNLIEVDGTKAYPPACFNLARFRMTGKGHTKFSHKEGYDLFDRACKAGHHGACHMQARMLTTEPGSFQKDENGHAVPYDPYKAMDLFEFGCVDGADSYSCFTLATMLLRGSQVAPEATNLTPGEARGVESVKQRSGEKDRRRRPDDKRIVVDRDPKKAAKFLDMACERGHPSACYNLAVMYNVGDDGVPPDPKKSEKYQKKTEELVKSTGGFGLGPVGG